jgi:hypothetical protein
MSRKPRSRPPAAPPAPRGAAPADPPAAAAPAGSTTPAVEPAPPLAVVPAAARAALAPAWPHALVREGAVLLVLFAALTVLAAILRAPLGPPADAQRPDNPEKAPWYLVGLQEAASYSTATGAVAFPAALALALVAAPLCARRPRPRGRELALVAAGGLAVTAAAVAAQVRGALGGAVLNPAGVALGAAALAAAGLGLRRGSWRAAVMGALAVLAAAYLVFVLVGALGRGPGWQFFWPWQPWPEVAY